MFLNDVRNAWTNQTWPENYFDESQCGAQSEQKRP